MIEYIVAQNPDDRVLNKAIKHLENDELICFPTDSNWVLGASPFSKRAVDMLYKLKGEERGKHFTLICNDISMASNYAEISDQAYKVLRKIVPGYFTFIFTPTGSLPRPIKSYKKEKEIGIRFPKSLLCRKLVETFKMPLITSSVTKALIERIDPTEFHHEESEMIYSYEIDDAISHVTPLILDPGEIEFVGPTTIIDFSQGQPVIVREGSGDLSSF